LYGWFTTSRILGEKFKYCVQDDKRFTIVNQYIPILSKYPRVIKEIVFTFRYLRALWQPLYEMTIQHLIKAIIEKMVPHILDSTSKTSFKVSIEWTRNFIKRTFSWSYKASVMVARNLLKNWRTKAKR
jgi:hypothetical protein